MKIANPGTNQTLHFGRWQNLGPPIRQKQKGVTLSLSAWQKKLRINSKGAIPKVRMCQIFHTHLPTDGCSR